MPTSIFSYLDKWYELQKFFDTYWVVCGSLHRKARLEGLVAWAKRKNIEGPGRYYRSLLIEEDTRIWTYRRRWPLAVCLANLAFSVNTLIFPLPKATYSKGYAKRNL